MDYGLTASEKEQLIVLLDKIQFTHCKNYEDSRFGWTCVNKFDNQICPFEHKVYSKTDYEGCGSCFYCPVFLISNVLEGK